MPNHVANHNAMKFHPPKVSVGRKTTDERSPKIEVQKDGDVIRSIKVRCNCGEVITIHCEYAETKS